MTCGFPAGINNGGYKLLNGTVSYLSHVLYACDEGYDMVGRARLVCDIDERWNGPPPRCEPILCEPPPEIENGEFFMSNNISIAGTVVEYSCNSRKFKLVGSKKIVCLPIGQYDKPPPSCKEESTRPIGIVGVPNKPTSKATVRPPRLPLATQPPLSQPPKTDREYEGIVRRPTKIPTSGTFVTTEKSHFSPTLRTSSTKPSETKNNPHVTAGHPQENEIPDSVNIRSDVQSNVNIPSSVEEDRRETAGARLNLGKLQFLSPFFLSF